MKGSVKFREKENRWWGRFYFNGKRHHVYAKSESKCWEEIRKKRKLLKEQYSSSIDAASKHMTLNSWFNFWVNTFKVHQVKDSTYHHYITVFNRYAEKSIGREQVDKITSAKLQNFINNVSSHDAQKRLHKILKDLFNILQHQAVIKVNPMSMVYVPRNKELDVPHEESKLEKVLTYSNEKIFLEGIKNARCYYAVKFILYSGLRRGECIGLQWKHVNLEKETITVAQQWNKDTKKITSPKSKAAYRTIPLMEPALEVLKELAKNPHSEEDFVFTGIYRLTEHLVAHSKKFDFSVNPHMLRHTFASRCYFAGVDLKIIQKILGHENADTTLNTYTHVLNADEKEIVDKFKQFFIDKGLYLYNNLAKATIFDSHFDS